MRYIKAGKRSRGLPLTELFDRALAALTPSVGAVTRKSTLVQLPSAPTAANG